MDIRQQDLLLWVRTFQFLPLLSRQILIDSLVWFGEQRGIKSRNLSIMRISRELERRWLELSLRGIFLLMIRFWSFRQMKISMETRTIWSMDARFITLRIFKFQEKEKTRLKSDFGLFFESDFFLICNIVYQQMERWGNSFEIQRIFQQEGKYSYAFFVKRIDGGSYSRISQQGLSVNVKLPVWILGNA